MFQKDPANEHFLRLLHVAEIALKGPINIKINSSFWGWPNLALSTNVMPKIEGIMESRIIYANPNDDEQDSAILRQVIWDAQTTRKSVLQEFQQGKEPSITHPTLFTRYVWVDMNWLYQMIQLLEDLFIPLKIPEEDELFREVYHLKIERSDRTMIEASWGKSSSGAFVVLSKSWENIWQQMTDFLQSSKVIDSEEVLQFPYP